MLENSNRTSSPDQSPDGRASAKTRWRHRVAFTASVYLDIETDSPDTSDPELERLAIEAVQTASQEDRSLPLNELGIDIPILPGGRLYAEPNLDDGLEAFSMEDCYELNAG